MGLAGAAQAQSHTNPVGERAMEDEIRKNERWGTFYDSLTTEERRAFIHWWDAELKARPHAMAPTPNGVVPYKRELRQGLQQWYSDEVPDFEEKRAMQKRYDALWQQRQQNKNNPTTTPSKKKTTIRIINTNDSQQNHSSKPRYYSR